MRPFRWLLFARTGRLILRNTNSGEANYTKQSKDFCSHDDHRKQTAESQSTHSPREPFGSDRVDQLFVVGSDERMCCTRVAGSSPQAREIAAPGLSEPVVCATLCPVDLTLGCLKWAAVGFVVAFALLKLFEASHLHDDIPKPAFKLRQTKRATLVLSTFAAMLSALVWLLVQKLD